MKIQILIDNPNSWIVPYAEELVAEFRKDHETDLHHKHKEVTEGDILILLSCERIFKSLDMNKHTLVVHESDLPKGKGWSPVTWQVLEGVKRIPVTLFEAAEDVDAGRIYDQVFMELEGHELNDEIKHKQGVATQNLIRNFIRDYPNNSSREQVGESTFYPRRTPKDSELDLTKMLDEQFNLLRVSDNERYPAFFIKNGTKYIIKIEKDHA